MFVRVFVVGQTVCNSCHGFVVRMKIVQILLCKVWFISVKSLGAVVYIFGMCL